MSDVAKVHDMEWYAEVPRSIWKQTSAGLLLLAVSFGGFGTWAFTAPLAAAVIAQGSFVATGQNKIVQHLEGGIIKEIAVSEGDVVKAGQPLMALDETAALAKERQLILRRARLEMIAARLIAQIRGSESIQVPEIISERRNDPDISQIVRSQTLTFDAWRKKLSSDLQLLEQNIESFKFRAIGYQRQREAVQEQLQLLREEHEGKKTLLDKGLLRKTEIKAIQRAIAEAEGQIGRLTAEISETDTQIVKQEQQARQTEHTYRESALDELQGIEADLESVREQSREASSVLRRAIIHAPVAGTIVRLYYHTSGGVIESGKPILEILPSDVPLIIEAQVSRNEIDSVRMGQEATVRLIALNQRTTPVLNGKVYYVSADSLAEQTPTGDREVYLARVSLPARELAKVPGFAPTPGMPAEILIQTAERTFFSYITKPVTDSMARAFMEQ